MARAALAITHPGTATLHAVLRGTPILALCNPSRVTKTVGRKLMKVNSLALPNLLLGRQAFPEFVVGESTVATWRDSALSLLSQSTNLSSTYEEVWRACHCPNQDKLFGDLVSRLFS